MQVIAVAIVMALLFSVISIDANGEQEAFNQGAIVLTLGDAAVCVVPLSVRLLMRRAGPGDVLLARVGYPILLFASLAVYVILGSVALGRVL